MPSGGPLCATMVFLMLVFAVFCAPAGALLLCSLLSPYDIVILACHLWFERVGCRIAYYAVSYALIFALYSEASEYLLAFLALKLLLRTVYPAGAEIGRASCRERV